jgi:sialate O-acetylesterase
MRGAIWYKGESNARRAVQYRTTFPLLIKDWRSAWQRGDFPFYFVQLAPFAGYRDWKPEASSAELREAQLMTHRRVPRTGMVVTTDITDDPNNIHPLNKQDVGVRLAGWALAETYRRHWPLSGPLYRDAKIEGDRIRIRFYHPGELTSRGEPLREFQIAGADQQFVDAVAEIDGRTVIVRAPGVPEPKAVRYGWSDTPRPNLRNSSGLPASPFRTDSWPGVTDKEVW